MSEAFDKIVNKQCERGYIPFTVVYEHIDAVDEELYKNIRMDWLGASDSSKLLDVNPFSSKEDLFMEKVTKISDDSIGRKASVRLGKDVEEIILKKLKAYFPKDLIEKPEHMYGNEETHLGINFDSIKVNGESIEPIEIKCVTRYGRKYYDFSKALYNQKDGEWETVNLAGSMTMVPPTAVWDIKELAENYGIPVYYLTQLQQQMLALRSEIGYLAVLDVDNWDLHIFRVGANHNIWEQLKTEAKLMWTKIECKRQLINEKKSID